MSRGKTIQRHIIEQQREFPEASGQFTDLILELIIGLKSIAHSVRRGDVSRGRDDDRAGSLESLVEFAQKQIYDSLDHSGLLCGMSSLRITEPISIPKKYPTGKYLLVYDPMNFAENSPAGTSAGSLFSIFQKKSEAERGEGSDFLQKGAEQVAAGYVVYGSTTVLVYTSGAGVHSFLLDDVTGEFVLEEKNIELPEPGSVLSVNAAMYPNWSEEDQDLYRELRAGGAGPEGRDLFYTGCLVADFHQVLMRGGLCMVPVDLESSSIPRGSLQLLHHCNPLGMIIEQAGGSITDGRENLMEFEPRDLHQRSSFYAGNSSLIEKIVDEKSPK